MNKKLDEGIELAVKINDLFTDNNVVALICPPFIHLQGAKKTITKSSLFLGAQNCASEAMGAFTGEVSAEMIKSAGASYVIIGHSERRSYYNEDDKTLSKKVKLALENNLTPVFCCGEVLEEREAGNHFEVVKKQIKEALFDLTADQFDKIVMAYEPVWAIGTGKVATPEQAQEMHKVIRDLIEEKYGHNIAENTSILYGGSCKPSNAKELFVKPDVDGGLIGGASLKAEDFMGIINAMEELLKS